MLKKIDYKYFQKAKSIAEISDFYKFHIGCVAVYKNKIVGLACNLQKTHPIQKEYNVYRNNEQNDEFLPKLHAEINCINTLKKIDINHEDIRLYISRKMNSGGTGMARPCAACMAAIKDFGIKDIYYTTADGYAYEKIG